jgi:hypothetical protein
MKNPPAVKNLIDSDSSSLIGGIKIMVIAALASPSCVSFAV